MGQLPTGMETQPVEDFLHVALRGVHADAKARRDVGVSRAVRGQEGNAALLPGEGDQRRGARLPSRLSGAGK